MSSRLYVGNLSYETGEESLRAAFSRFGQVLDVHVVIDRYSGRPRGFAFVTMGSSEEAARAASAMNGTLLEGHAIKVDEAPATRPQTGAGSRRGT